MCFTETSELNFDEKWYLEQNQDVANCVRAGRIASGLSHYLAHGKNEGRLPFPPRSIIAEIPIASSADSKVQKPIDLSLDAIFHRHNGRNFLVPNDLAISETPLRRVAFIGSCFLECWNFHKNNPSKCAADLIVMNNAGSLPSLADGAAAYDFQVIQIPLRSVLRDSALWHLPYGSIEAHERAFNDACDQLAFQLKARMDWNIRYGLLTFVANFLIPQRNLLGCLFPRFDLRNPEFFVERLNEHIERLVRAYKNAYVLDVDRIAASLGRRYVQDDLVSSISHNALIGTPDALNTRMELVAPMSDHFEVKWPKVFPEALWAELVAMYRTVRQIDAVKLVVVDLDDTLWNGVSGDMTEVDPKMVEGWPLGLAEALVYLKKRGILLAIVSKNDEMRIRGIWPKIFGNRLKLEDFAAIYINWKPKFENIRDLLDKVNLLPRSVVFIDDNPVERAGIKHAFPDMRVLGRHPYYIRQTLLWSSETQVVYVTEESSHRTEMVQAQIERESHRKELSRDEFLEAAAPRVTMIHIEGTDHERFPRAFELINKSNQFNTTGRRWKIEECGNFFEAGGLFQAFEVSDNYTGYGLVGVVIVKGGTIVQWVMSCRVLGYQIEEAVMASIVSEMRDRGLREVTGYLLETDVNFPCRDLFSRCGFEERTPQHWFLPAESSIKSPSHVTLVK